MRILYTLVLLYCLPGCDINKTSIPHEPRPGQLEINVVNDIRVPDSYIRVEAGTGSFAKWLRELSLKKEKTVYLYNGKVKENQTAQYAVLDIPVGKKDLQQCADAVMRLRAEYLFAENKFDDILFIDNAGKKYSWQEGNNRIGFESYLANVFGWCGSASLEKQLISVKHIQDIQPGDVFIRGGFPGHAMIVADVAINESGEKIFMLAQSYMPAQDIHIVNNPMNKKLSPWYEAKAMQEIITPEWKFETTDLKTW
jgi:Domain of unknown function (4846)